MRATQNRITGHFNSQTYLGKPIRQGAPNDMIPVYPTQEPMPYTGDTSLIKPLPYYAPVIDTPDNPMPTGRTATIFDGNGGGSLIVQKPVRQFDLPAHPLDNGDIVPPFYPVDLVDPVTTLPTLTPTSPTVAVVQPPTLTPTSSPVGTILTTTDPAALATVPSAVPLTTTPAATPGYVTIFGMQIPTIWLWIGGGFIALYFLFGGNNKKR